MRDAAVTLKRADIVTMVNALNDTISSGQTALDLRRKELSTLGNNLDLLVELRKAVDATMGETGGLQQAVADLIKSLRELHAALIDSISADETFQASRVALRDELRDLLRPRINRRI